MKKAQQVIADIERFKLAAIELIDRAIALKTCPYEDVLCFEPYLTSSLDSKWKFHWKAAFDTIKIHYEMKGYIVNLQGKRHHADDLEHYQNIMYQILTGIFVKFIGSRMMNCE